MALPPIPATLGRPCISLPLSLSRSKLERDLSHIGGTQTLEGGCPIAPAAHCLVLLSRQLAALQSDSKNYLPYANPWFRGRRHWRQPLNRAARSPALASCEFRAWLGRAIQATRSKKPRPPVPPVPPTRTLVFPLGCAGPRPEASRNAHAFRSHSPRPPWTIPGGQPASIMSTRAPATGAAARGSVLPSF